MQGKWLIPIALAVAALPASADVELVEQSTKTIDETTITFDSSFQDLDYDSGDTITIPVSWIVDAGTANFRNFVLRGPEFTPKGPDPANGELLSVVLVQDSDTQGTEGLIDASLRFTELHCESELNREIGNAHFHLVLDIDQDGDGATDKTGRYGVNVHVEDPGACTEVGGGPPPGARRGGPPPGRPGPPPGRGGGR